MKDYIKHIVEDFNFNRVNVDNSTNVVLQELYKDIFNRIVEGTGTETDFELFDKNIENGYPFKYKARNEHDLSYLVHHTIICDLNWVDVSGITDMSNLFLNINMSGVKIDQWDVSNVTNMSNMFTFDRNFNSDISKWNVSNVTNMYQMFYKCYEFDQDLSNWNVSKVRNMNGMFRECESFDQDLSSWDVSNASTNSMFDMTPMLHQEHKLPKGYKFMNPR